MGTLVCDNRWKVIDFAELKHSSISFFDIEQHETAISRWSRAKVRAAKVTFGNHEHLDLDHFSLHIVI